jgi:hypothetical protein
MTLDCYEVTLCIAVVSLGARSFRDDCAQFSIGSVVMHHVIVLASHPQVLAQLAKCRVASRETVAGQALPDTHR